jgi:TetR/AcrR family transcriptional regulator, mexJK operon transcriptional repressor
VPLLQVKHFLSKKSRTAARKSRKRPRPSPGRPTRSQSEHRHNQLLARALDEFLEHGYELATIDAIGTSISMTKRTIYGLYKDKKLLFRAAVKRAIDEWTMPIDKLRVLETDDLEATLMAIARVRVDNAISPIGLKLQRIVNAESFRFPDMSRLMYEQGAVPTIDYIANLLQRHAKLGKVSVEAPELLAQSFLTLLVGGPTRGIVLGRKIDMREIEKRIRVNVKLFLDGIRTR